MASSVGVEARLQDRLTPVPKKQNGYKLMHVTVCFYYEFGGVADGARTHDNRNHNPGLYQLSYSHH
jgi:hypothetical protein